MFLADDIVLFPVKSLLLIFREIHKAAVQEIADEADSIRTELGDLYRRLESGELDESSFDARESDLLDRLDAIEARGVEGEEDDDEGDPDDEEEDEEEEGEDDLDEEVDGGRDRP